MKDNTDSTYLRTKKLNFRKSLNHPRQVSIKIQRVYHLKSHEFEYFATMNVLVDVGKTPLAWQSKVIILAVKQYLKQC